MANNKRIQQKRLTKTIPDLNSSVTGFGPSPVEDTIAAPFGGLFLLNQRYHITPMRSCFVKRLMVSHALF